MPIRVALFTAIVFALPAIAETPNGLDDAVETALKKAGDNRAELEKALNGAPKEQRAGVAFLVANMPDRDLKALKADFLLANTDLAYKARKDVPWGKDIPDDLFLNDVLPYANIDEKREAWRADFVKTWLPVVKECKTPAEAAQKLNGVVFQKLNVKYSTGRKAANQSPSESISQGKASCTGLSIILCDACRAVCIPARLVGTPLWANNSGNHTWVEVWDHGWHFTGACEPDPAGLDRGWFVGNAAQAKKDSFEHSIYAASFKKTDQHFPLVWAMRNKDVPAENVTDRYAKPAAKADTFRLMVRVVDGSKKRVAVPVTVTGEKTKLDGKSRGETADTNDLLTFDLPAGREFTVAAGGIEKKITTGKAGEQQTVEMVVTKN
jgi:Transglutaminase-like superfamily